MFIRFAMLAAALLGGLGCAAERLPVWSCPPIPGSRPENRSVTSFYAAPGSAPAGASVRAYQVDGREVGDDIVRWNGSILMGLRSPDSLDDVDIELRISTGTNTVQKVIHIDSGAPTIFYWVDDWYRPPRIYVVDRLEGLLHDPTGTGLGPRNVYYDTRVERALIVNMVNASPETPTSLPRFDEPWEHSVLGREEDWWITFLRHSDGATSGCWEIGPGGPCTRRDWAEGLCPLPRRTPRTDAGPPLEPDAGPFDAGPRDAGRPPD